MEEQSFNTSQGKGKAQTLKLCMEITVLIWKYSPGDLNKTSWKPLLCIQQFLEPTSLTPCICQCTLKRPQYPEPWNYFIACPLPLGPWSSIWALNSPQYPTAWCWALFRDFSVSRQFVWALFPHFWCSCLPWFRNGLPQFRASTESANHSAEMERRMEAQRAMVMGWDNNNLLETATR